LRAYYESKLENWALLGCLVGWFFLKRRRRRRRRRRREIGYGEYTYWVHYFIPDRVKDVNIYRYIPTQVPKVVWCSN